MGKSKWNYMLRDSYILSEYYNLSINSGKIVRMQIVSRAITKKYKVVWLESQKEKFKMEH